MEATSSGISLSDRLAQRVTQLGLQPGQQVIDYSSETEAIAREPRAGGTVIVKATGERDPANKYVGDDVYRKVYAEYDRVQRDRSDLKYIAAVAGLVGLPATEIIQEDNTWRLQQLASNIRDAYLANLKKRQISVEARQGYLERMLRQQEQLQLARKSMSSINAAMAPTVGRFYWLATMTGYPFATKDVEKTVQATPDLAEATVEDEFISVVPFWLLVRHVRPQYRMGATFASTIRDKMYWEPSSPKFRWMTDLLEAYRSTVMLLLSVDSPQGAKFQSRFYLFLRDMVLSTGLRFCQPVASPNDTKMVPVAPAIGRYANVFVAIDVVKQRLMAIANPEEVRKKAVTRSEVQFIVGANTSPVAVVNGLIVNAGVPDPNTILSTDNPKTLQQYYIEGKGNFFTSSAFLSKWFSDRDMVDQLTATGPLLDWFNGDWQGVTDAFLTTQGNLSMDGFAHWWQVTETIRTLGGDYATMFLPGTASVFEILSLNGRASDGREFALNDGATDIIKKNILDLFFRGSMEPGFSVNKIDYTSSKGWKIELVITDRFTDMSGADLIFKPLFSDASWVAYQKELVRVNLKLQKIVSDERMKTTIQAALLRTFMASCYQSHHFRNEAYRNSILETIASIALNKQKAESCIKALEPEPSKEPPIENPTFFAQANRVPEILDAFAQNPLVPALFYRELFRSTFSDEFRRERIKADKRVSDVTSPSQINPRFGDVKEDLQHFGIEDSTNSTAFLQTWEPFYANIMASGASGTSTAYDFWAPPMRDAANKAYTSVRINSNLTCFETLWQELAVNHTKLFVMCDLPANGIPPVTTLQINLGQLPPIPPKPATLVTPPPTVVVQRPGEKEASASPTEHLTDVAQQEVRAIASSFYAVMSKLRTKAWEPALVPVAMYQESTGSPTGEETGSVPPLELFQAMIAFTLLFYPTQQDEIMKRLAELQTSIDGADRYIRSVASADREFARKDVEGLVAELDLPDMHWQMQALFTGRLTLRSYFTSGLDMAYSHIQRKAAEDWEATAGGIKPGTNKRGRPIMLDTSYHHLMDVPLDVLTCNTEPATDSSTNLPTRDYIDTTQTPESIRATLRIDMALLHAQCIVASRLDAPDQYKTIQQYQRSPEMLRAAMQRMRNYTFTQLGPKRWRVERRV